YGAWRQHAVDRVRIENLNFGSFRKAGGRVPCRDDAVDPPGRVRQRGKRGVHAPDPGWSTRLRLKFPSRKRVDRPRTVRLEWGITVWRLCVGRAAHFCLLIWDARTASAIRSSPLEVLLRPGFGGHSSLPSLRERRMVEGGGFEPPYARAGRFTVCCH